VSTCAQGDTDPPVQPQNPRRNKMVTCRNVAMFMPPRYDGGRNPNFETHRADFPCVHVTLRQADSF